MGGGANLPHKRNWLCWLYFCILENKMHIKEPRHKSWLPKGPWPALTLYWTVQQGGILAAKVARILAGSLEPSGEVLNKNHLFLLRLWDIGMSVRRSSRLAFGRSTGNDVSGQYKHHYFLFLFSFFSPSSTFLIEGVLWSKNLFSESCLECPKT